MDRDSSSNGSSKNGSNSETELRLGQVLAEYTRQKRAGERPDIEEYARRHPELRELRELLTTVDSLERVEPDSSATTGIPVRQLGPYRVEREVGRGGMGVVFLAHDETLDRRVALKLLPVQATLDARFLARFQREARAAAKLSHPNIVPVFGVGEDQGMRYYAMQYVEGHPLDQVLRKLRTWDDDGSGPHDADSVSPKARGLLLEELSSAGSGWDSALPAAPPRPLPDIDDLPLSAPKPETYHRNVAQLVVQIADALAYAHSRGVLHRDIKPSNLLLSNAGRVWITDFGLCKTGEADAITATSDFVGTLRYMAPEQVEGRADVRSDVYELGATLYELLTLHPIFPGRDRAALVRAVVEEQPLRPRRVRRDVPKDLEAICLKAIAKLPEERYGTAAAFGDDLRAFLEGRPIQARPPGVLQLLRLLVRRNRPLAIAAATFAFVLGLATFFYLRDMKEARDEQDRQLYLATLAAARVGAPALERAPEHLRNWEWNHYSSRIDNSVRTIDQAAARVRGMAIDPTGQWVVYGEDPGVLHGRHLTEGRSWTVHSRAGATSNLAISPDGNSLVAAARQSLELWSLRGVHPVLEATHALHAPVASVHIDESTARIFVGDYSNVIHVLAPDLSEVLFALHGHSAIVLGLRVIDDGRTLVSCGEDETLRLWNLETREAEVLHGQVGRNVCLDVSPDEGWIAVAGSNNTIQLWNTRARRSEAILSGHNSTVTRVRFSPDGLSLASSSTDQSIRLWDVDSTRPYENARPYRPLWGHKGPLLGAEYLPDGRLVSASIDGEIKEWDPSVTGGFALFEGHVGDVWNMEFSPSGKRLLTTGRDGTVRVWDVTGGGVARVLFGARTGLWTAQFSPDERFVAAGHRDGIVRVWDLESAQVVAELMPPPEPGARGREAPRLTFHPTEPWLYVIELSHGICVWERTENSYRFVRRISVPGAMAMDVDSQGRLLGIGTHDGRVLAFDTTDWSQKYEVVGHDDQIQHLRFEPNGRRLFSAGFDGKLSIWRARDGKLLREIQVVAPQARITRHIGGLGIWPDGSRVACATEAQGVTVWDTRHGDLVATLRGPGRGYLFVDVSPDGRRVACGSWDGVVRVWDDLNVRERQGELLAARAAQSEGKALFQRTHDAHAADLRHVETALHQQPDSEAREAALGEMYREMGSFEGLLARLQLMLRTPDLDHDTALEARALAHGLHHRMRADRRVQLAEGEALLRVGQIETAALRFEPIVRTAAPDRDLEAELLLALAYARSERPGEARRLLEDIRSAGVVLDASAQSLLAEAEAALSE